MLRCARFGSALRTFKKIRIAFVIWLVSDERNVLTLCWTRDERMNDKKRKVEMYNIKNCRLFNHISSSTPFYFSVFIWIIIVIVVGDSAAVCQVFCRRNSGESRQANFNFRMSLWFGDRDATAHSSSLVHNQRRRRWRRAIWETGGTSKSYSIIFNKTKIRYNNTDGITIKYRKREIHGWKENNKNEIHKSESERQQQKEKNNINNNVGWLCMLCAMQTLGVSM